MLIVVGFVESPEGHAAVERAVGLAAERSAKLLVLHSMRGGERDEAETVRAYDEAVAALQDRLATAGIEYEVKRYARGGSPADDLAQAAEDFDADLIVIGIRRRSPVGKLILGSNAQDIILTAPCDVLCVKPARD